MTSKPRAASDRERIESDRSRANTWHTFFSTRRFTGLRGELICRDILEFHRLPYTRWSVR